MSKVAIVHDWFVDSGGAEKVVAKLVEMFPSSDIFSAVDYLDDTQRSTIVNGKFINTSFIQKLPRSKKYKKYFPLMPLAMESLDLSRYDVIISSSSSVAKGVITGPDQVHICYCHSPMRYAWDLQHQYLKDSNIHKGIKGTFARVLLYFMRNWDVRSSFGVDIYIANSMFISKRIKKTYRRDSVVIHPGVDVTSFECQSQKNDYYFTCSRMVPYKKIQLIVKSFSMMPDKSLIVIGDGPEMDRIKCHATPNVTLMGYQPFDILKSKMAGAKAFVFAAEEDFGIVPVEAQACGTPVIAYGKGGALETVIENETGLFFGEQTEESLIDAIKRFEGLSWDPIKCRKNALRFSPEIFQEKFLDIVLEATGKSID